MHLEIWCCINNESLIWKEGIHELHHVGIPTVKMLVQSPNCICAPAKNIDWILFFYIKIECGCVCYVLLYVNNKKNKANQGIFKSRSLSMQRLLWNFLSASKLCNLIDHIPVTTSLWIFMTGISPEKVIDSFKVTLWQIASNWISWNKTISQTVSLQIIEPWLSLTGMVEVCCVTSLQLTVQPL